MSGLCERIHFIKNLLQRISNKTKSVIVFIHEVLTVSTICTYRSNMVAVTGHNLVPLHRCESPKRVEIAVLDWCDTLKNVTILSFWLGPSEDRNACVVTRHTGNESTMLLCDRDIVLCFDHSLLCHSTNTAADMP